MSKCGVKPSYSALMEMLMRMVKTLVVALALLPLLSAPGWPQAEPPLMNPIPSKPAAIDFKLPDTHGKVHTLADFRGKYVLVNFWATWCGPCVKEMPALHQEYERLKKEGLEVIGIHAGPGQEEVGEFLKQNPVGFTILIDNDLQMGSWGVPGLPTTYMLDPKGHQIFRAVGNRDWNSSEMTDFLRGQLGSHSL